MNRLYLILGGILIFCCQWSFGQHELIDIVNLKKLDSLKSINLLNDAKQKADSIANKLSTLYKLDSPRFNNPLNSLKQKRDSLRNRITQPLNTINNKLNGVTKSTNQKLDSVTNKLNETLSGIENKVQGQLNDGVQKLNSVESKGGELLNQAGIKLPEGNTNVKLPELNNQVPDLSTNVPNLTGNIPNRNLNTNGLQLNSNQTGLDLVSGNNLNLPNVNGEMKNVTEKLGDVNEIKSEAGQYLNQANKLKGTDLSNVNTDGLEKKAFNLSGASEADAKLKEMNKIKLEQEQLLQKYKDEKLVKAELKRKLKNVVNDQINMSVPAVQKAQQELAAANQVKGKMQGARKLFSREENEWNGRPFKERLIPGLTFQVSRTPDYTMDIAPQVGYHFNGRLIAGIAGTYRLTVNKRYDFYLHDGQVYGGRLYTDFKVFRSFYLHGELESLKMGRKVMVTLPEGASDIVWGSRFGLGKQFNMSKRVSAMMLGFYRIELSGHLPKATKYNLRLVFNLRPKEKKPTGLK